MTEGRHQRDETEVNLETEAEMEAYLNLYGDEGPVDGVKQLPARGGRHADRSEQ